MDDAAHPDTAALLADEPVAAYLSPEETVEGVLTNRAVGLGRSGTQVKPGEDWGAVAAVTDRRLVVVVGRPPEREGDFAMAVPHECVDSVGIQMETLARALVVETASETLTFTARESDEIDGVMERLQERVAERLLTLAREYREAAAGEDAPEQIDPLEAALDAFRDAAQLLGDGAGTATAARGAREDAEAVIADLVAAYREHGGDAHAAGRWELEADNPASARELLTDAREAFERALELAEAYPPGDASAIADERTAVAADLAELDARTGAADGPDGTEERRGDARAADEAAPDAMEEQ